MRIELADYLNQYVLCKGWITGWEQINEKTFRAYIDKPVIKKPNKDAVFDDLETISIENHINLFLPYNVKNGNPYNKYDCVVFTGYIREYTRKDGTKDYGVYPIAQSTLHEELFEMAAYVKRIQEEYPRTSVKALLHLEQHVKPYILHLEEELEDAGDLLPTFYHTYDFYHTEIQEWKQMISLVCKLIRVIHSNRKFRRKNKIKENYAIYVPEFEFNSNVAKMRNSSKCIIKKGIKKH